MAFTNKIEAVVKAEELLSAAGVDDDAIGAIVAVLSDDATSLERVNITLAGDQAVAKLKALVRDTGSDEAGSRVPFNTIIEGFGPLSEGIKGRIRSGIYSYRSKTVDSLLELVQEKLACLLIAPPCTGKTALCVLAAARAQESPVYSEVYYIDCGCMAVGTSFEQEFQRLYGRTFASACCSPPSSPSLSPSSNSSKKRLIVVDEVQNVYEPSKADALWALIKYITSNQELNSSVQSSSASSRYSKNINVLLTGSRGSSPVVAACSTPLHFSADQRIPFRRREPDQLALQFTVAEYEEFFLGLL